MELSSKRGTLELWTAPGDSELDVAYNRPELVMQQMKRSAANEIHKVMVGFQGEMYNPGEEGFRTWRTDDGRAAKPQVETGDGKEGAPDQGEIDELLQKMEGMDASELYKEQERRAGREPAE